MGREHHHEPGSRDALEWSLCCVEAIFGRAKALEVAGPMVTQPATLPPKRPFEWRLEEEVLSRVDPRIPG